MHFHRFWMLVLYFLKVSFLLYWFPLHFINIHWFSMTPIVFIDFHRFSYPFQGFPSAPEISYLTKSSSHHLWISSLKGIRNIFVPCRFLFLGGNLPWMTWASINHVFHLYSLVSYVCSMISFVFHWIHSYFQWFPLFVYSTTSHAFLMFSIDVYWCPNCFYIDLHRCWMLFLYVL